MDVLVRVDVATSRPPADHDSVFVRLSYDLADDQLGTFSDLNAAVDAAVHDAHMIAVDMAMCHPHVVMPTRVTTLGIDNL